MPEPVRRHLGLAVPANLPPVRTVDLRHDGFFRPNPGPRWFPIKGEQYFALDPPGFVWHARVRMLPLLWIEARDSLISGPGGMLVKLNSFFTLVDARGPEVDQGSAARWLAETVWFPMAFASDGIRWESIDDRAARATLQVAGLPVNLVVEFDEAGRVAFVRGERYRAVEGGKALLTAWLGRCTEYRDFGGVQIPSQVEACWDLAEGQFSYARFRVTAVEYS